MSKLFRKNLESLEKINPSFAFYLQRVSCKERAFQPFNLDLEKLKTSTVIYAHLVDRKELYLSVEKWLLEKKERRLVFLEEDLENFAYFLSSYDLSDFLAQDQIEWSFIGEDKRESLKRLIWSNLYLPAYYIGVSKELIDMMDEINRGVELTVSFYQDFGLQEMRNLFSNLKGSENVKNGEALKNQYQGVPAIICGAGPSLEKNLNQLQKVQDKALIFSAGSALAFEKITSDFGVCLDPKPPPQRFSANKHPKLPVFYQDFLCHELFSKIRGHKICLGKSEGFPLGQWLKKELNISLPSFDSGWNAATFATHVACYLGCSPIIFLGMDCCTEGGKIYSEGIEDANEGEEFKRVDSIPCVDRFGNKVFSRPDFLMGKEWIEAFAKTHQETTFINANEGGLIFEGIENVSLLKSLGEKTTLLKKQLLIKIDQTPSLGIKKGEVENKLSEISTSIKKCLKVFDAFYALFEKEEDFKESHYALQDVELSEQIFYQTMLEPLWEVWRHMLQNRIVIDKMGYPPFEKKVQKILFFKEITEKYDALLKEEEKLSGVSQFFSRKGELLSESFFVNNKQEGETRRYYPSGTLYAIENYKNGVLDGKQEYYYETGQLKSQMEYKEGVHQGEACLFLQDGKKKEKDKCGI